MGLRLDLGNCHARRLLLLGGLLALVCAGARNAAAQAPAYLVKDINLTPNPSASSSPRHFVTIGTTTFFSATLADRGGLWRTEGTAASTTLVKDFGADVSNLIDVGGTLFFTTAAYDAADGLWSTGLWRSAAARPLRSPVG